MHYVLKLYLSHEFTLNMMDFTLTMIDFILKMMDFIAPNGIQVFDRASGRMMIDHLYPYGSLKEWAETKKGFEIST